MTYRVKRCFDLSVQIEDLTWERQQLESKLTYDELTELATLLERAGEANINEGLNLKAYSDVKRETEEIQKEN